MDNFEKRGIKYTLLIIATTAICMMLCFLFMAKCVVKPIETVKNTEVIDTVVDTTFNSIKYNDENIVLDTVHIQIDDRCANLNSTVNINTITINSIEEYIYIVKKLKINQNNCINNALKQYTSNNIDISKTQFFKLYADNYQKINVNYIFVLTYIQFNYEIGNSQLSIEQVLADTSLLKQYFEYIIEHNICDLCVYPTASSIGRVFGKVSRNNCNYKYDRYPECPTQLRYFEDIYYSFYKYIVNCDNVELNCEFDTFEYNDIISLMPYYSSFHFC